MVRSDPNINSIHQGLGVRFRTAGREGKGIGGRTSRRRPMPTDKRSERGRECWVDRRRGNLASGKRKLESSVRGGGASAPRRHAGAREEGEGGSAGRGWRGGWTAAAAAAVSIVFLRSRS
jgi:hypothetical protein